MRFFCHFSSQDLVNVFQKVLNARLPLHAHTETTQGVYPGLPLHTDSLKPQFKSVMTSAAWEGKGKYGLNKGMMVGNTSIRPQDFLWGAGVGGCP